MSGFDSCLADFFVELGFDFKKSLKSETFYFEKEPNLTAKLKNSVFFYSSPPQTNTSFYLIAAPLNENEKRIIRKYIWNKNNADLIFLFSSENSEITMSYAKYSPVIKYDDCILERFAASDADLEKIEKIKRWRFDSGAFWLNYYNSIKKTRCKGIDKELIATLNVLRDELDKALCNQIKETKKRNETVQALIDRTLYIKYLEDNHIINSFFYKYYFEDDSLTYKGLLELGDGEKINRIFEKIHEIFNNKLFDDPKIRHEYLTPDICKLIAMSFSADLKTKELRLFDFQFDVLPIEFISYIYEVFLTEEQKKRGIYYTPKKLAQLIVDDVIKEDKIGSILDPSCGSGMFLIVGYQRLLEIERKKGNEPENNIDKIRFRTKLLKENIFGIEKQPIAHRLALFSLSLQIFQNIPPEEIKEFIKKEITQNKKINLFSEYDFYENILCENTLNIENQYFNEKKFHYIVGNPPFFEIKNTDEEISFLKNYDIHLGNEKTAKAKDIVGTNQISQCFFLKLKDWANDNTRFGFVSNSSTFYNDHSIDFQNYFYTHYGIEKIYELSRVKKILFKKAKESVVVLIFSNKFMDNTINYYPVEMGLFSEKPFELLIIEESKAIEIKQEALQRKKIKLRDYLVGNEFDRTLINRLKSYDKLESWMDENQKNFRGLERIENNKLAEYYNINSDKFTNLSSQKRNELHNEFANETYIVKHLSSDSIPYLFNAENITPFHLSYNLYIKKSEINKSNFRRFNASVFFDKTKILLNRHGKKLNAALALNDTGFSTYIYCITLKKECLYYLVTALLNSQLVNYFINSSLRKRVGDSFSKIGQPDILNIPIPKELDEDLVEQISKISKDLTEGKFEYSEKEEELNELIFDLYDLSYIEKRRIKDSFLPEKIINKNSPIIAQYTSTLINSINFFLNNPIKKEDIEFADGGLNLLVAKIPLRGSSENPTADKVQKFIVNEIFTQNPNARIISGQEKIFGKDCVYIVKECININWTETKAFEDGQDILKCLITNENGE